MYPTLSLSGVGTETPFRWWGKAALDIRGQIWVSKLPGIQSALENCTELGTKYLESKGQEEA